MLRVVGISEMAVSRDPAEDLITYSLGSCVALILHDPFAGIGGMIHCMLPLSKTDPKKAEIKPCMFIDTGVVELLKEVYAQGATRKNLVAKVVGGAVLLDSKGLFKIGERNYAVLRKLLWKNNILVAAEEVGGTISRTVVLRMADGRVFIRNKGVEREL